MRKAGIALTVAAAAAAAMTAPAPAHAANANGCARTIALMIPGTTETSANADPNTPTGMLAAVGNALEQRYGKNLDALYVPYPGEAFFNGTSYAESKSRGDEAAAELMQRCATSKFVVAGYSQGAQIGNDLAVNIGHGLGPVTPQQVKAVILLANPKRGTEGATLIGPPLSGQGIAGPAPEGFGKLAGKVFDICHPDDAYCNTDGQSTPFLASLGRIIANPPGAVDVSAELASTASPQTPTITGTSTVAHSSLVDELSLPGTWRNADLSAVFGAALQLAESVSSIDAVGPTSTTSAANIARMTQQARLVSETLTPVDQARQWIDSNPGARETFTSAPEGSPEAITAGVLDMLEQVDVPAVLSAAEAVTGVSTALLKSRASGESVDVSTLAGSADALVAGLSPLAASGPVELRTATQVLSVAKPTTIINQLLGVVSGVTSVDYPAVAAGLQQLPIKIATGDVHGAHAVAGDLNNQLSPLVKMAAGVDFKTLSRLVAMVPDPSGTAAIAALVLDLLGNVDVIRLARNVGEIQEIAWSVAESGNVLELSRLMPVAVDLAQVALGVLTPGQKMSPDQLHDPGDPIGSLMAVQVQDSDLAGLSRSVMALASSDDAVELGQLVTEGFTAASFYASNSHIAYPSWSPDGTGTAIDTMVNLFAKAIG
ncbi:cutinase family protein [Rhodococcus aetherivorans]|uniref:cutinase family protein n=1 Tax=Rhodococcus aetherivorans TaxID=191292 RepID=UPI00294A0B80|nr:cutinase family protein [Rhodococcus aetherivorans]MDV6296928.1 cutinase family protein [Rhodococcus aetherivorans]